MNFAVLYRVSFDLMLFFATLTLSVDATESPIAMLYPLAVAVAAVASFLTVDRDPRLGLDRRLSNWLALLSIGLVFIEYSRGPELLLLSLAHWLVYLQLIKMFLPKRIEDDWFLFLLGLMQVMVGTIGSQSDHVGMAMGTWALLALWVLALFSLHRDALRARTLTEPTAAPARAEADPYPGLLNAAFVVTALRVTVTTMALGGVIFLAMPRRSGLAQSNAGAELARHLTGFDEEVKLGQLGEILENDSIVMSIELYDSQRPPRRIKPPPEPLWRGVTMADYREGRWQRQRRVMSSFPSRASTRLEARPYIRQQIRLEATDSPVLFGLRPMINATSYNRSIPELNGIDGTIVRSDSRSETYDYRVFSDVDPTQPQVGESLPSGPSIAPLLEVPPSILEPLREIAEKVVKEIPEDAPGLRAQALEAFLQNSGQFRYSLHLTTVDFNIDPVLDFLVNTKSGHCGYYASGLTLLLRSVGIPARMVNGFKGGDWNDLAQVLSVRQKHAHSWVEALIPREPGQEPTWVALDPTPGAERNEVVARVGGIATNFRQFTDFVRYVWTFYIVGYNSDRQRYLLYDPIRQLIKEARSGFQMMGQGLRSAATAAFGFRDVSAFISVRGFVVSFLGLLAMVGLVRGGLWLWWRFWRWFRGDPEDSASLSASQVFYRRLTQLLAEFGLERPSAETQFEFAHRASAFLTGRGSSTAGVSDVPPLVVAAYYRVRFGHRDIAPETIEHLDRRLDALEASLHAN
jgi:transglutaminase-like putative cysteine protease